MKRTAKGHLLGYAIHKIKRVAGWRLLAHCLSPDVVIHMRMMTPAEKIENDEKDPQDKGNVSDAAAA